MEMWIYALVVILVYFVFIHLTTKLYIKKVGKETSTIFKGIILFIVVSIIYLILSYLSTKIFNYGSVEKTTEVDLRWITMGWPGTKFNTVAVLMADALQLLSNILYVYIITSFIKGVINNLVRTNIYMILFYIVALSSIATLNFGYYGFLQGNFFDFRILKNLSDIIIFSNIVFYPIFMYKDIIAKKFYNNK